MAFGTRIKTEKRLAKALAFIFLHVATLCPAPYPLPSGPDQLSRYATTSWGKFGSVLGPTVVMGLLTFPV